jgi:hypothetical protein
VFQSDPTGTFTVVNPAGGAGSIVAAVRELIVPVPVDVVA